MVEIKQTSDYAKWIKKLKDHNAVIRITARIKRLANGNPGGVEPVGEGVSELRIDYGPGYWVYYKQFGDVLAILLCGGDKSTQTADIVEAKALARAIVKESVKKQGKRQAEVSTEELAKALEKEMKNGD
jgi:putative addiction module killer protein